MKIGMLSTFIPEKDGIAVYIEGLVKRIPGIIRIGRKGASADYIIDFQSFELKKKLKEIIEKEELDVLHIQHITPYFSKIANLNLISALDQKIPVVVTLHEVHYNPKTTRDKLLLWIEKQIAKRSVTIVHTPKQKERFNATKCIYQGLEINPMHKKNGKKILLFGIISRNKGVEYLIEAMKHLQEYELTIAGRFVSTQHKSEIMDKIRNIHNIKYRFGWISETERKELYENADFVVLPYLWAPYQSAVFQDAMSFGIPVVVTNADNLPDLVREFNVGEVIPMRDTQAIVNSLELINKDYIHYQKNIEKYRKEVDWENITKKHLELYESLVESNTENPDSNP